MCNVSVRRFLTILGQGRYAKRMVQRYCYKRDMEIQKKYAKLPWKDGSCYASEMAQYFYTVVYTSEILLKQLITPSLTPLHQLFSAGSAFIYLKFFFCVSQLWQYSNKLQINQQFHFLYDMKIVRPISRLQIGCLGLYWVVLQKVFFIKVELDLLSAKVLRRTFEGIKFNFLT